MDISAHRPRSRRLALAFVPLLLAGLTAAAQTAPETPAPPTVLPKLTVGAEVPLLKVAEHRMREPRFATAAVAHRGAIYIISGLNTLGAASPTIERFDVATGRTEIVAHLRIARLWHRTVVVADKIYILGGSSFEGTSASASPSVDRSLPPAGQSNAPVPALSLVTAHLDLEPTVEIFDPLTRAVSAGPKMPDARNQFGCVPLDGALYVFGGVHRHRGQQSYTNTTLVLDLAKNQWRDGPPMPQSRAGDATLVDGGFVIVPGGYNGRRAITDVDVFNPRNQTWNTISPLTQGMSAHATAFLGSYLFLFGNYDTPEQLLAYNLKTKQSETFTLGYTAARHAAVVVHDRLIYVIGGREHVDSEPLNLIQVFAPTKTAKPR